MAGSVATKTLEIGLRFGLFEEIAKSPDGLTADSLAKRKGIDPVYTGVWCRSTYAAEVLNLTKGEVYKLAPHVDRLLLDEDFPGYIGALPGVFSQPEMFDYFAERLGSGERIWWDQCSPTWIQMMSGTGRAFYNRLIPGGLSQVPGLSEKLDQGIRILEMASGAGVGLERLARTYPKCVLAGVDGDGYSLELTRERLRKAGLAEGVSLTLSTLEDYDVSEEHELVINNISMHECRDIEKVTQNVYRTLVPGGYFVISDFPFPESTEECRTVPARLMCGIQFFEATIGDQLLPIQAYLDLLNAHGFRNVGTVTLTPVHALTYGQK